MLPFVLWTVRNLSVASTPVGQWRGSDQTLSEFLWSGLGAILDWTSPSLLPQIMQITLFLLVVASIAYLIYRRKRAVGSGGGQNRSYIVSYLLFLSTYLALLAVTTFYVSTWGQTARYLTPILPVLVILIV